MLKVSLIEDILLISLQHIKLGSSVHQETTILFTTKYRPLSITTSSHGATKPYVQ
jgi:hypothetical protein